MAAALAGKVENAVGLAVEGQLVIALVRDIDFRTWEKAKEQVEKFKTKHPNAKELPAK